MLLLLQQIKLLYILHNVGQAIRSSRLEIGSRR
jgi:hypothetical protein